MVKKGDIVMIYHDPVTEQSEEAEAKLLRPLKGGNRVLEYWQVKFCSDGFVTSRFIKKVQNG